MKTVTLGVGALLLLMGCQMVPDSLPKATPPPAAACHFSVQSATLSGQEGDDQALLTKSIAALEALGFELVSTDTSLGWLSASRQRALLGYYDSYDSVYGGGNHMRLVGSRLVGSVGIGSRGSSSIGVGVGFGGRVESRPTEVERVSLFVNGGDVRISRDIRRFDHLRDLRESYSASSEDFCQRFQAALLPIVNESEL